MNHNHRPHELLIITGATGVGKTELAVELARQLDTEIISADSMQVYRHLSIGTAKPRPEELRGVACHLIDYVEPDDQYNLGRFLQDAEPHVRRLGTSGKIPIVCGGTGLYLRGLLYGVFEVESRDLVVREQLDARLASEGLPALYAELMRIDPNATHITPNDRQRILRALEVYQVTGKPITSLQTQHDAVPRYHALSVVLTRPRPQLHSRIHARVDAMLRQGLLDEVRRYLELGYSENNPAIHALGYSEMIDHLRGNLSLEEATEAMKRKSRQYAKRQETWFRSMKDALPIDASSVASGEVSAFILNQLSH